MEQLKCCKISCGPQAATPSQHLHFLATYLLYQNTRLQLNGTIKSVIVSWDTELMKVKEIFNNENVVSLSKYVLQLLDTRFPKDKEVANTKASKKTKKQKTRRDRAENLYQPLATQP